MSDLIRGGGGSRVQTFPLRQGFISLTSGTYPGIDLLRCVDEGNVTLNFKDGTSITVLIKEFDDYTFHATSIEILTGTFHLAEAE